MTHYDKCDFVRDYIRPFFRRQGSVVLQFPMTPPLFMGAESYMSNCTWLMSAQSNSACFKAKKWGLKLMLHYGAILVTVMMLMKILLH